MEIGSQVSAFVASLEETALSKSEEEKTAQVLTP